MVFNRRYNLLNVDHFGVDARDDDHASSTEKEQRDGTSHKQCDYNVHESEINEIFKTFLFGLMVGREK